MRGLVQPEQTRSRRARCRRGAPAAEEGRHSCGLNVCFCFVFRARYREKGIGTRSATRLQHWWCRLVGVDGVDALCFRVGLFSRSWPSTSAFGWMDAEYQSRDPQTFGWVRGRQRKLGPSAWNSGYPGPPPCDPCKSPVHSCPIRKISCAGPTLPPTLQSTAP